MNEVPWFAVISLPLLGLAVRLWGRWASKPTWWLLLGALAAQCLGAVGAWELWRLAHETPFAWAPMIVAGGAVVILSLAAWRAWRGLARGW